MKISSEVLQNKINTSAITAIEVITTNNFPDVPMFFGGIGLDKFPTAACVFSKDITVDECYRIEVLYMEEVEMSYNENGEDIYVSEPTFEGVAVDKESNFDERLFKDDLFYGVYVLNGEFYDSIKDVVRE